MMLPAATFKVTMMVKKMLNDPNVVTVLATIDKSLAALVDRDRHYEFERRQHISDVQQMNETIASLVKSNKEVSENINRLITKTETSQTHIDTLYELVKSNDTAQKQSLMRLSERVGDLEKHNFVSVGERRASEKQSKFWQDNWFKIVSLFILSIPLIVVLFDLIKRNPNGT